MQHAVQQRADTPAKQRHKAHRPLEAPLLAGQQRCNSALPAAANINQHKGWILPNLAYLLRCTLQHNFTSAHWALSCTPTHPPSACQPPNLQHSHASAQPLPRPVHSPAGCSTRTQPVLDTPCPLHHKPQIPAGAVAHMSPSSQACCSSTSHEAPRLTTPHTPLHSNIATPA
jgi:hypothetical protein